MQKQLRMNEQSGSVPRKLIWQERAFGLKFAGLFHPLPNMTRFPGLGGSSPGARGDDGQRGLEGRLGTVSLPLTHGRPREGHRTGRLRKDCGAVAGVESSLRVTCCRQILQSLPGHNYTVLSYLMGFLHEVSGQAGLQGRSPGSEVTSSLGLGTPLWP